MNAIGGTHPGGRFGITLDLSRLLSRAGAAAPTGIDRIELAYAEYLLAHAPERTEFAALHPLGRFGTLPTVAAERFIRALAARWDRGADDDHDAARLGRRLLHGLMMPLPERRRASSRRPHLYLLLSHHHLTRPAVVAETVARRRALFVPMVHDLIPMQFPEYARPREPARHALRIETVVTQADAVLVPSEAVRQSLLPHLERVGRTHVPVWPVPHGVHPRALPAPDTKTDGSAPLQARPSAHHRPYFVCLGTIEPRKNHLMLLTLWRRLVEEQGHAAPRLILIGKRGWENENILDMIERCPMLQGVVEEHNALPDLDVTRLLAGARALLFPSFAEGYGLPLAEALSLGVPSVCSDIPVFREIGREAPLYLDPLDALGWKRAIERLAGHGDIQPPGQRLKLVQRVWPEWPASVSQAMKLLEQNLPDRAADGHHAKPLEPHP